LQLRLQSERQLLRLVLGLVRIGSAVGVENRSEIAG
jgi:hypothetical protein